MKNFINRILDVSKLIRTIWFILWIILIILLVMKFCFGIWYPIVSKNEWFNNLCNYIEEKEFLRITIKLMFFMLNVNLIFLSMIKSRKYFNWYIPLIINIVFIGVFFVKEYIGIIAFIFEGLLILSAIIINIKKKTYNKNVFNILNPILVYAIMNLWQLSILLVRDLDTNNFENYSFLIQLIIQLDYYIFISILYMEVCYMGSWSLGWFFSKDITVLKAAREKELARKTPNMETIAKIDKRIAELEKEGK